MSNYGRNFEFIVPPNGNQRKGRFFLDNAIDTVAIGAPVVFATSGTVGANNALDLEPVIVADGAQDIPVSGRGGIAVYEYGPAAFAGDDPSLTTYSDKDTIPAGAAVQVISGSQIKVRYKNTAARTFLESREYAARTMVAGLSAATPTVVVGELLTPQTTPNDSNGYWVETSTASEAWLVITKVDAATDELEAQMTF